MFISSWFVFRFCWITACFLSDPVFFLWNFNIRRWYFFFFSLFFQSSIILTHDILTHNNKIVSSINMFSFLRKMNQTCDVTTVSGLVLYWKSLLLKYPFHVYKKDGMGWAGLEFWWVKIRFKNNWIFLVGIGLLIWSRDGGYTRPTVQSKFKNGLF